jgi:DDE domain
LDNGSRVNREVYARFCERLRVRFPGSTHPYIRVKGQWRYLYRAVDKAGKTIDFLFGAKRDKVAARRFFEKSNLNNVVEVRHEVAYRSCSHFSRYRRSEPPVSPGESRSLNQERL